MRREDGAATAKGGIIGRVAARRPTTGTVRLAAGLVVGAFVVMHFANHMAGLVSLQAMEAARAWLMTPWHTVAGQLALYGALITHVGLGLYSLGRRRHLRLPGWEWAQLLLGLSIPYLLIGHIVATRATRLLAGIDISYEYEIAGLWLSGPEVAVRHSLLVLLVWGHFAVGLHFWLRLKPWYGRSFAVFMAVYALVPAAVLAGFTQVGMDMQAAARPGWAESVLARGVPADPAAAALRQALQNWAGFAFLALVAGVLAFGVLRGRTAGRQHRISVRYAAPQREVTAPLGFSLLEASRLARVPHMSVCGGRARCTTCRVRVIEAAGDLPAPNLAEANALMRIGAPPGVRLACQMRPTGDIEIQLLIRVPERAASADDLAFGEEREVTVLFLDLRGSTRLAEKRFPYDVVFIMNQFFGEMSAAISQAGGHYSNFTGDGLMALFGLDGARETGARQAVACAFAMCERLEALSERLADEIEAPLAMGIGIHTGFAIVGRMGPPETPVLTALGDTVNTAARLEALCKTENVPLILSEATAALAGLAAEGARALDVTVRGRSQPLPVLAFGVTGSGSAGPDAAGLRPDRHP